MAAVGSVEGLVAFVFACRRWVLLRVVIHTTVLQFLIFIVPTLLWYLEAVFFSWAVCVN